MSSNLGLIPNPNAKIDCAVDWKNVNTKRHTDNLIEITGNKNVGLSVARIEREILLHRDGTEHEDLYMLDARTGLVVDKNLSSNELGAVDNTKKMERLLNSDDANSYIMIHNHPYSMPPSEADFNSLYKNPKLKYGIIICHDGTVYKYTAPNHIMQKGDINIAISHYKRLGNSDETARAKAYESLMKKYNFKMEVIDDGKRR